MRNLKTEYEKCEKGIGRRLIDGIKEYFGPFPVIGGMVAAGAAQTIAFSLGVTYQAGNELLDFLKDPDIVSAMYDLPKTALEIYSYAKDLAGEFGMPAFVAGQFFAYKFKKGICSLLKKRR